MTLGEPQGKKSNTSLLDKDSDDLYSESSSVGQLNIECQNIISSDQLIQDQTLHQAWNLGFVPDIWLISKLVRI